jgi:hypothetical protein
MIVEKSADDYAKTAANWQRLPQVHSACDTHVTHCSSRYQQTLRERLGPETAWKSSKSIT